MKGRKPSSENVVPLTEGESKGANLEARGRQRAAELKPEGLAFTISAIWDRIAPPLCDPRKNRLNESNAFMFEMLCRTIERHERLRVYIDDEGETYESETRNGVQLKNRPEVGQLNATWAQIRSLASDFGMTPAAERGLQGTGQMGFSFDDDDGDFD
ncbi:P27 family phage terminase small subunit [Agrobacterium tumefaciens]|uniref:P27 family phage terminase small subunit n=1 Tax=Agrobacterium tumefaciens TaxID=358 RepID=UPI001CBB12A1|nr:P27 family phage terminase small subunit [Agrobacterium tumefaciens]MDP9875653.1 P27 family predicted phage terminase small subunit [Agrobacterium tumefaciens]MDP9980518.1 P27 family predicted phage terminase small subunit [Agrobacterium tumefaciens]